MKRLLLIVIVCCVCVTGMAQQEFVVQGNHAEYISYSALDTKRNVLVTFGYTDNTLKFWNEKTGLLYRTIDAENSFSKLVVNSEEGKVYGLAMNTIVVFSTETFEKIKEYPLGRIYSIDFSQFDGQGRLTLFAQDQNYMTSLYALDESKGTFLPASIPPLPVDEEVTTHYFTPNGKYLFVVPSYESYYAFDFAANKYIELKGDYIALFNNGDVLRSIYDYEKSRLVYQRMNPETRAILWTQTFEDATLMEGLFQPTWADVSFTLDHSAFWVETTMTPLTKIDAQTGKILGSFPKTESIGGVLDAGDYVYAQLGATSKFGKYEPYNIEPLQQYGNNVIEPTKILTHRGSEGLEFVFSTTYGTEVLSLFAHPKTTQLTKYVTNFRDGYSDGELLLDQSSDKVYSITSTIDPIKVFQRGKAESFKDYIDNYRSARQFDFSENTKQLVILYDRGLRVINTKTNKETTFKPMDIEAMFFDAGLTLSPNSNSVAYISREILGDQIMHEKIHYFDFGAGAERWVKEGRYFAAFHVNGGKELLVSNATTNTIEYLDVQTGEVNRSISFDFKGGQSDAYLSPNEDYLFYNGTINGGFVYHLPSEKVIQQFDLNDYGNFQGSFVTNTIIAIPEYGGMTFMDITNQKKLLKIYIFEDESWVAYTPEGQFDGTQKGWEKVAFLKNKKTIPLESVFDQFYTPRLVHQVLAQSDFKTNVNIETLVAPPAITVTYKEGTRNLYVTDDAAASEIITESGTGILLLSGNAKGSQIKELRLYHNGKRVGSGNRNLVVEDDVVSDPGKKEFPITLVEGTNEFSAIAVNAQGTESTPEKLVVNYTPANQQTIQPRGIQAHILVVGIDEYQNPKYNINYAVEDASSFQETVSQGLKDITTKTHLYFIKNTDAVRGAILDQLTEIAAAANPQDIFVFYYAGHGVIASEGDQQFYLVPSDVTQLYGNDGALAQKGISAEELTLIASGIPAQKQLYILDACQSAGALTSLTARGAAEEKAIAQLARSTGTHWLTASGSQQFATEFDELGHGVFTYVLLEALSGKADSGDKRITVNELKAYIESRVPEISEQYKGSPQYPSSFGFGQDFPVSISKN